MGQPGPRPVKGSPALPRFLYLLNSESWGPTTCNRVADSGGAQASPEAGHRRPAPPDTTKDRAGPCKGSAWNYLPRTALEAGLRKGPITPEGPSSELRMAHRAQPRRPPQLPCLCRCWFGKEPGDLVDYIYQGPIILVLLVRPLGVKGLGH